MKDKNKNPHLSMDYMPNDKSNVPDYERELRFGTSREPIPATAAWKSEIKNFPRKDMKAESWILVNEHTGTMTFTNTYDGKTGTGYDVATFTFPLDPKKLNTKIGSMEKVEVDECPVAILATKNDKSQSSKTQHDIGEMVGSGKH